MCASDKWLQSMASGILYTTLFMVAASTCGHRLADVRHALAILVVDCAHHSLIIRFALLASLLSCTENRTDVGCRVPELALDYTILNLHSLWTDHISRGLCTLNQHGAWLHHIAFGVRTMVNRHQKFLAFISFGRHTLVSRRQAWPTHIAFFLPIMVSRRWM